MTLTLKQSHAIAKPRSPVDRQLDRGFVWMTQVFALAIAGVLIWITLEVLIAAFPAMQTFALGFLTSTDWNPVKDQYGALPQIFGTLASSFLALLLAIPVGLGVAVFLTEDFLPTQVQTVLVFFVELLAAIPSVVYGLWGIFVLIPLLRAPAGWLHSHLGWFPLFSTPLSGPGMLPAGVILAIMILPTIAAISRDALVAVPKELKQAALGLGATPWETILLVMLPAAFSGIVGAIMLALGRAMGETMAVTMLIGNSNTITASILAPANTISSLLANQFAEAKGLQVSALMYAALVLFFLTLLINILAEMLVRRVQKI
ncbi:phosphate ABC transporter permease [Neosynechococcus sphagnicola sy1]|uniref:Phosphate transport system permease protein n=1 Tax=Neosynechococcus sphagnicola sy1 TaxID=1497020 RepID=A0A098TQB4_9CYAN|nr:phosphate ABC transporter permease subunit PstC [Neosynechococcus sphagnicola]KGF73018.1 phosphate ABC transporter permease [Neosynechococcus sphagnicola sy1]